MTDKKLRIKLVRSPIGYNKKQRLVLASLGLRKMHSEVIREDNPYIRGMVKAIPHLLFVEEIVE